MASTPTPPKHEPPKPEPHKSTPPDERDDRREDREHKRAERKSGRDGDEPKHPILTDPASLFKNGHRIAKDGDPPQKWISMGRLSDGTAVHQMPMTDEIVEEIKNGEYYLADGLPPEEPEAPPPTEPEEPAPISGKK